MFYIPPILVVSTFSQHIISSLYECGVLLPVPVSVCLYFCDVQIYAFRFQKTDLYSFGHSSAFFCLHSHFMCNSNGLRYTCSLFLHRTKFQVGTSNKIFRMTASTLSTCVTAKILNLSSFEQLQHILQ